MDPTQTPQTETTESPVTLPEAGATISPDAPTPAGPIQTTSPAPSSTPPIEPSSPTQPPEQPPRQAAPTAPEPPKNKGGWLKSLLISLVVLAVLAGAGYAAYVIWKPATSSTMNSQKDVPSITVGVIDGSISLYPDNSDDSYGTAINLQVFEGLVAYQDQTKLEPLLATGWTNPNSSTWDFDLRHNVSFHNGHTMTAADVVYSMNFAKTNESLSSIGADTIQSVKALNDYKVEIKTTQPDPFFLNKLTRIMILDAKQPKTIDISSGTGPYVLKPGTKPTKNEIQLVAFDKYHGGHVYTRALNFIDETNQSAASKDFKAGKINMAGEYNDTSLSDLKNVHHQRFSINTADVDFLTLNSVAPGPLQKQAVRQALRDSIDNQLLIKDTDTAAVPANQLMTQAIPGYNPSLPIPKRDITKAKALLASAGINGRVALTLETSSSNLAIAQEVATQAQPAGFDITVEQQSDFDQLIEDMANGKNQLTLLAYSSDVLDGADVFTQVLQQTANYKSATLDSYLDQATNTIDPAQRLQIVQKASKYIYDDVAAIPLFSRTRTWATDKPYTIQFDSLLSDPGVYFWKVSLRE